jgi:hypothetical protein
MNYSGAKKAFAVLALSALRAWAVDGVAVSTQTSQLWPSMPGGDIIRYDIRNNDVVSVKKLVDGGGGTNAASRGKFPALELSAARVAFYHCTNNGNFVAVINIDGTGLRDLARIPDGSGYNTEGYLDWPAGKWIYYQQGGDEQAVEGNKHLWRVNVDSPAQNEEVASFGYNIWQWGMSSNASRMILRLCCGSMPCEMSKFALPSSGPVTSSMCFDPGVGCATALSPSGQWVCFCSGGLHIFMTVKSWDPSGQSFDFKSYPDINSWAVNASALTAHCSWYDYPQGIDIGLGFGMDCNRWSSNSDNWLSLCMGWLEDSVASGRYAFCGANQVVANWREKIALNVSKSPRACADKEGFSTGCDKNAPADQFRRNDAGDFIVTAPLSDINADLRQYVTGVFSADRPRTPPEAAVWRQAGGEFRTVLPSEGLYQLSISDATGRVRWSCGSNGKRALGIPRTAIPPGIYLLTITHAGRGVSASVLAPAW